MSVALRTITRLQDADDFGSTPGAGNDGYALTWDNDTGAFGLTAMATGGDFSAVLDAAGGGDYTTLAAALAGSSAGDVVFVKNGTYAGGVTISLDNLTLLGESRNGVIIQSPSNSVTPAITVSGNKVTLDDLKIDGRRDLQTDAGTGDVGAQDYSGVYVTGDDVTIRNVWVFEPRGMGIVGASGADRGSVLNCRVENRATNGSSAVAGAYSYGILVTGTTTRWQVLYSLITGWSQGAGLWYGANECIVAYCRIVDNYGYLDAAHTITRSAVEDYGATETIHGRNVVAYNVIDGSTSCCIECAQGVNGSQYTGNILRNYNHFSDNTGKPFTAVDGGVGERTLNISFVGNQIYGSDVQGACLVRAANALIDNNLFQDMNNSSLTNGVLVVDSAISVALRITRNTFRNCQSGIDLRDSIASGAVIANNAFLAPVGTTQPQIKVGAGSAHVVDGNYIDMAGGSMPGILIDTTAGDAHTITNNTLIGFTSTNIDVRRGRCQITNNYLVSTNVFGVIQLYGSSALYNNVRWNYCDAANAGRTIYLDGGATKNVVQENNLIGAGASVAYGGTGWPTTNGNITTPNNRHTTVVPLTGLPLGAKTVGAAQATIAHGLPWPPVDVRIVMTSAGTIWRSAASDDTNIYLSADDADRTCEVWVV